MKIIHTYILLAFMMSCFASSVFAEVKMGSEANSDGIVRNDTIDPDDEEAYRQKTEHAAQRMTTGKSALDFVLESRHRFEKEDFRRKWYDHMFLELGSGTEKIQPASDNYFISQMVCAQMNIGKQLTPFHTLRMGGAWHHGSQRRTHEDFDKIDGHLDYLFNVTSYMYGYDPMRRFEVSTILGAGVQSVSTKTEDAIVTPMLYTGLQLKINTGAYSYIGVEPYIGIMPRRADHSKEENWRTYNVYYGVNVNLAHYFSNNLSQRQKDSIASRAPWFMEISGGPVLAKGINLDSPNAWGKSLTATLGKWFSPVFGIRLGCDFYNSSWWAEKTSATETNPAYYSKHYSNRVNARADLMINPLGFSNHFSWESKYGMFMLGGIDFGSIKRHGSAEAERTYTGIDLGLHLWTRLSRDLQFFIEPRYSRAIVNEVRTIVMDDGVYHDDALTVDLGITMQLRTMQNRRDVTEEKALVAVDRPWAFGFLLGLPITQTTGTTYYSHDTYLKSLSYNALTYLKLFMGQYHAMRLSVDYMSNSRDVMSPYYDIIPVGTDVTGTVREGLWKRRSHLLTFSMAYSLDMMKLLSGTTYDRSWQSEIFFGPALMCYLGETSSLNKKEKMESRHVAVLADKTSEYSRFGLMVGAQLTYNINRRMSLVCVPRLYIMQDIFMPGYTIKSYYGYAPVGGISLGFQYRL